VVARDGRLSGPDMSAALIEGIRGAGVDVIDGKLYVADSGNHRAVRFAGLPTEDGEVPALVLGQDNLDGNEANRRGMLLDEEAVAEMLDSGIKTLLTPDSRLVKPHRSEQLL